MSDTLYLQLDQNIEVTTLPVKEHEYGFGERSGE